MWHFGFAIEFHLTGNRANETPGLLLFKEEGRNIGEWIAVSRKGRKCTTIDNGIMYAGVLLGDLIQWDLHQKAYGNDQTARAYTLRSQGEILDIVILRYGLDNFWGECV